MAVVGGRRQVGARRKEEILDAATRLFHMSGYSTTSLEDIADQVGLSKPALYYYFDSKDDILFEIVDRIVNDALVRTKGIIEQGGSAADRLYQLLVENTRLILENIEANTVFYNSRGLLTPEREKDVRARERDYTQFVRKLYETGVQRGELVDIDPAVATYTLLGASIWAYRWFVPGGRLSRDQVAQNVAQLLMDGFMVASCDGSGS